VKQATVRVEWLVPTKADTASWDDARKVAFHAETDAAIGKNRWELSGDGATKTADIKAECYPALCALLKRYGLSKFLRRVEVPKPPMTLERWAGLRHATIAKWLLGDGGYSYACMYHVPGEPGCWDEVQGPVCRNPLTAMKAAKEQDEKRRASK